MKPLVLVLAACAVLASTGCGAGASATPERRSPDPLDSITAEELYRRGVLLVQAGDSVRAEQYIAAAIDRGFSEEQAMPALMHACVQASRLSAALNYAEPYLARHPGQWPLRLLVASIHMGLAQHERARAELDRVLRDAPEDPPEAHYFLGVLLRDELEDMEGAREHFRRYLALAPEGAHRDEALAALPPEERGIPIRMERHVEPPDTPAAEVPETEPTSAETEEATP